MSIKFNLEPIITPGKPGALVNFNIQKTCENLNIFFNPNHSFYINDLNSNKSRGNHSNSNANEVLVCLSGSFDLMLFNGKETKNFVIEKNSGIYIPNNTWVELNNFKNCIIVAYVEVVNKKESIYDYDEYKKQFN